MRLLHLIACVLAFQFVLFVVAAGMMDALEYETTGECTQCIIFSYD